MVAELFKKGIEHHFGIFIIQYDGGHFAFGVPFPSITIWNIEANLVTDLSKGFQCVNGRFHGDFFFQAFLFKS